MITLAQAAKLYDITEETILDWATNGKITTFGIGNKLLIDEKSLERFFELTSKISYFNEYQEAILRDKKEELDKTILQLDDYIFLFKSIHKISPFFHILIKEMASLICNERKRDIFIEITSNLEISDIAKKYNLSYDKILQLYESALKIIIYKAGFLNTYRSDLLNKDLKIIELETIIDARELEIKRLYAFLKNLRRRSVQNKEGDPDYLFPPDINRKLALHFKRDFDLDTRTFNCLRCNDIETVEELLLVIKGSGFKKLLNFRNFGIKSVNKLRAALLKENIIDEEDNCDLFIYV